MKLYEAIRKAEKYDVWFRPKSWSKKRVAYEVRNGIIYEVPSLQGGFRTLTTSADLLCGEWEVVHPDDVLNIEET